MKGKANFMIGAFYVFAFVGMLAAPTVHSADEVAITGKVSSEGVIVTTDGEEYVIIGTEVGHKLLQNAGKIMHVRGTVTEEAGTKAITVHFYKIIQKGK
jgi:hypothetical protein